jgi:hypothetical protein
MNKFSKEEVVAALEHKLALTEDRERELGEQLAAANNRVQEMVRQREMAERNLKRWFKEEFISNLFIDPANGPTPMTFGNIGPKDGSARFVYE